MVHMAHHSNDRRTVGKFILAVLLLIDGIRHLSRHIFGAEAELLGYYIYSLRIEPLVD